MSDPDTLVIRTRAGLTLRLTHHRTHPIADHVSGELSLPLKRADRGRRAFGAAVAFLAGGERHTRAYIDHVDPRWPSVPPHLWLGGASIDLDATTAATVQAWLDSRTPYVAPDPQPAPARELPADIATPVAVERAA